MDQLLFLVLLLTFCLLTHSSAIDGNVTVYDNNGFRTNCTSQGISCVDCNTAQYCSWNNETNTYSGWSWECTNRRTCSDGLCTHQHERQCYMNATDPEFECRTPGMYPDPYDCKKYYYCVPDPTNNDTGTGAGGGHTSHSNLIKYSAKCDCSFGYNAHTKICDKKLLNGTDCNEEIVPSCRQKGQSGQLWSTFSIYYVCLEHNSMIGEQYPYLYDCDHGKIYNSRTYLCE